MLQTLRVCPWKAGEGDGTSSLQLLTWVLLQDILAPSTPSKEQNRNRMFILRCLSVNPGGRLRCRRSGLSRTVRPEGDPGMSFMPLVQGYNHLQVRNITALQILAQWKWIPASACLASHICSLKVFFPSFHSLRKFATLLLGFSSSFIFLFPFIFLAVIAALQLYLFFASHPDSF